MPSADDRAVIAYIHPGQVDGHFCASLTELVLWDQQNGGHIVAVNGLSCTPRLAEGRNSLCRTFLSDHPDANWLLMLDSDMTFSPYLLSQLLETADGIACPVMSGLYFNGSKDLCAPEMYALRDDDKFASITVWTAGTLLRADAVGGGCLLLHRSVLERMRDEYPPEGPWFSTESEDIVFCRRLMALGYAIIVDSSVVLGHCKRAIVDDGDYYRCLERLRRPEDGFITDEAVGVVVAETMARRRWTEARDIAVELGAR